MQTPESTAEIRIQTPKGPRRARVLISAYACSPDRGSECAVGWNCVREIARAVDARVLCQDGAFGEEIRRYLARHGPIPGLEFVYIAKTPVVQRLMRFPGLYYLGYHEWQKAAFRKARELQAASSFDLVHQLNLCSFREPGLLGRLGPPFLWGSWGGTGNYPWRFLGEAGLVDGLVEATRGVVNRLQLRLSPAIRRGCREAVGLLANNSGTIHDFERTHRVRPELLSVSGIHLPGPLPSATGRQTGDPFRILWAGRLETIKALSLLIRALPQLSFPVQVHVLGEGRCLARWQALARRLGVAGRIRWLGWLPHAAALAEYRQADVLVFTSLRDSCPLVIPEALAAGLPVICLDHMGMADQVTEQCGIKIAVTSPARVARDLAAALTALHDNPARREHLARAARDRAVDYSWPRIGERLRAVYRRILCGSGSARPALSSYQETS